MPAMNELGFATGVNDAVGGASCDPGGDVALLCAFFAGGGGGGIVTPRLLRRCVFAMDPLLRALFPA